MRTHYKDDRTQDKKPQCTNARQGNKANKNYKEGLPVKLAMWDFGQCDTAKCSGKKLVRLGFVKQMDLRGKFGGLILSPNGKTSSFPS